MVKTCRICGEPKPLDDFPVRVDSTDGRRNDCRDCTKARSAAYRATNRDRLRRELRERYYRNREQVILDRREFRKNEAERINQERRAARAANPEKFRAVQRAYYAANPEKIKDRVKRRDFYRRFIDVGALVARDGEVCGICGKPLVPALSDVDHKIPRSIGGSNDLENLQLAHVTCNRSKNKNLDRFAA